MLHCGLTKHQHEFTITNVNLQGNTKYCRKEVDVTMVDTQYIENRIDSLGFDKNSISKKLGISRQSLWKKINNKVQFKVSEVYVLSDILLIPKEDRIDVFFKP